MTKRDCNEGRSGSALAGLGLLTAAGFVALSFAGKPIGDAGARAQTERHGAVATAPEASPARTGFID